MNTISLKNYLFLVFIPFFISCSNNDNDDLTEPPTNDNAIEDVSGIWTLPEDDMYYLALYPSGRYTFCLSEFLIGSGTYYLNGNTLILNDGYTFRKNELIVKLENEKLNIRGNLYGVPNPIPGCKEYIKTISLYLNKSNESFSKSIVGISERRNAGGLNAYYSSVINEISFISDYIFRYTSEGIQKSNGKWKTIKDQKFYYVYREPYVYCYNIKNSPTELGIYDFSFIYDQSGGMLVFDMEVFRVR